MRHHWNVRAFGTVQKKRVATILRLSRFDASSIFISLYRHCLPNTLVYACIFTYYDVFLLLFFSFRRICLRLVISFITCRYCSVHINIMQDPFLIMCRECSNRIRNPFQSLNLWLWNGQAITCAALNLSFKKSNGAIKPFWWKLSLRYSYFASI